MNFPIKQAIILGLGGHHITCAQNKRNFLSKRFMSSGTESGVFCIPCGTESGGSTIGKTLGKGVVAVAGAVAIQANSTWLFSGATVILNFLKKSCLEWNPPQQLAKILL
jgi:hypothetical protein